jgi:hypothetical protein
MLTGASSGSLFTWLLGVLGDKYDIDNNPTKIGPILTIFVLISYFGSIPFFLLNAREYAKNIKYQRLITNYVAKHSKHRLKIENSLESQDQEPTSKDL